jgi:hypothetical protein
VSLVTSLIYAYKSQGIYLSGTLNHISAEAVAYACKVTFSDTLKMLQPQKKSRNIYEYT